MSYEEFGTPSMPADPSTPMQESAAAARELYLSYVGAGFTTDQALYLAGCVVVVLAQNEMLRETEIVKQAMLARVMEQADELRESRRRRGGWAAAYGPDQPTMQEWLRRTGGSTSPNVGRTCAVHGTPLLERLGRDGQRDLYCPACGSSDRTKWTWYQAPCPKCGTTFFWMDQWSQPIGQVDDMRKDLEAECPEHGQRFTEIPSTLGSAPADFLSSITPKCFICRSELVETPRGLECPVHRTPGPRMGGGW